MSAGGGLATGLTLLVRDQAGPPIRFQLLDAPQVDDQLDTPTVRADVDTPVMNQLDAEISWRHYLSNCADDLPTLTDRVADLTRHRVLFCGDSDPLPVGIVAEAERIAADLLRTAPPDVLLHGDLHHDNVLWGGERGWLAIDPHGLVGDPAYEVAPLLYNPMPLGLTVTALAEHHCRRLAAATGIAEERIRAWGFVQAVLSAVWSLDEDPTPDRHVLALAERLHDSWSPGRSTA